jgi:ribosomal protein S18 acetylase RimI-like enzyme
VNDVLNNPVYQALLSGDQGLNLGTENVKFFDEKVSPFAGFDEGYSKGFDDLFDLLPSGRLILYATPRQIKQPRGWRLLYKAKGLQMVLTNDVSPAPAPVKPVPLQDEHIEQMMQLAGLTKPGPFGPRTIDFGHYHGIFEGGQLAAMTGQRLHVQQFTEISAVCTHPDHLGKGYASALVQHQVSLIRRQKKTPFLHVRQDNQRAIEVYQRLGFTVSRPMNFYFMKRRTRKMSMPLQTPSFAQSQSGTVFTAEV